MALMLGDLELRLGRALRAVQEAQLALGALGIDWQALVADASGNAVEAPGRPVAPEGSGDREKASARVLRRRAATDRATTVTCRRCGEQFEQNMATRPRVFCSESCRARFHSAKSFERKKALKAEQDRQVTQEILAQNTREGYPNLPWGNGHVST